MAAPREHVHFPPPAARPQRTEAEHAALVREAAKLLNQAIMEARSAGIIAIPTITTISEPITQPAQAVLGVVEVALMRTL